MLYIPVPDKPNRTIVDFRKFWRLFYCLYFVILTEVLMFFPRSRLQKKVWNCWMICGLAWRKLKLRNPKRRKRVSWSSLMQLMKYGHCFGFCYWFVIRNSWCVFVHCVCVCSRWQGLRRGAALGGGGCWDPVVTPVSAQSTHSLCV